MSIELVSVHIPKAGGSSLAQILGRAYGRRLYLKYPPSEHPFLRKLRDEARQRVRLWSAFPGPRALHGHFPASEFSEVSAPFITFIRDPVAQRISTYHYHRRQYASRRVIANLEARKSLELSIDEYLSFPAPIYSTYLDVPLKRFEFVGTQENFDEDMQVLSRVLGLKLSTVRENVNPEGSNYRINSAQREKYERANPGEMEIYRKALERRNEIFSNLK